MIEVAFILIGTQAVMVSLGSRDDLVYLHGRHGRDVEAEQSTTNDRDGRDVVNVANLIHVVICVASIFYEGQEGEDHNTS